MTARLTPEEEVRAAARALIAALDTPALPTDLAVLMLRLERAIAALDAPLDVEGATVLGLTLRDLRHAVAVHDMYHPHTAYAADTKGAEE